MASTAVPTAKLSGAKRSGDDNAEDVPPAKGARGDPAPATLPAVPLPLFPSNSSGVDDVTERVMDLVAQGASKDSEIEVRLGCLVDRYALNRVRPTWIKTGVVVEDDNLTFDARVSEKSFVRVNKSLNDQIEAAQGRRNICYKKSNTVDIVARDVDQKVANGVERRLLRHTYDQATGKVTESVEKSKSTTVDYYNARWAFDLRFRASNERVVPTPANVLTPEFLSTATRFRKKERRSYSFDCLLVEMTRVEEYVVGDACAPISRMEDLKDRQPTLKFELEVELDKDVIKNARDAAASQGAEARATFAGLCKLFVDTARALAAIASRVENPAPPSLSAKS